MLPRPDTSSNENTKNNEQVQGGPPFLLLTVHDTAQHNAAQHNTAQADRVQQGTTQHGTARKSAASVAPTSPATKNNTNNDTIAVPIAIPKDESREQDDGGHKRPKAPGTPVWGHGTASNMLVQVAGGNRVPPRLPWKEAAKNCGPDGRRGGRDEEAGNDHYRDTCPNRDSGEAEWGCTVRRQPLRGRKQINCMSPHTAEDP